MAADVDGVTISEAVRHWTCARGVVSSSESTEADGLDARGDGWAMPHGFIGCDIGELMDLEVEALGDGQSTSRACMGEQLESRKVFWDTMGAGEGVLEDVDGWHSSICRSSGSSGSESDEAVG